MLVETSTQPCLNCVLSRHACAVSCSLLALRENQIDALTGVLYEGTCGLGCHKALGFLDSLRWFMDLLSSKLYREYLSWACSLGVGYNYTCIYILARQADGSEKALARMMFLCNSEGCG